MAQNPHIIDLRRSYIPMDPNAFPPTMHATEQEDSPEPRVPVIPYDGKNFMPTPQGYSSFFGINSHLDVDALSGNVDEIFTIQTNVFQNFAVALKDDGIWTKSLASTGAWTHVITISVPSVGVHKNWSKCVIDQNIYVYRQGEASYWVANPGNSYVFTAVIPTFLNMAGQLGIFKAGGRLGFWDSENSTSWSALTNHQDFTPSLETFAGNTIFQDIVGKIVMVLQHGTGFIIYCTRSIVLVERAPESAMLFRGKAIFTNNGISYRKQVVAGDPDTTHYVMSITGFCEITNGVAQFASPEASTYFKKSTSPIALEFINGRYLFFQFIDPLYTAGRVDFEAEEGAPGIAYEFQEGSEAIQEIDGEDSVSVNNAAITGDRSHQSVFLYNANGYATYSEADEPSEAPVWKDILAHVVPLAELAAFVASSPSTLGSPAYFAGKTPVQLISSYGIINTYINTGNYAGNSVSRTSPTNIHTESAEPSEENFWEKQRFLWKVEDKYQSDFFEYLTTTFNTAFKAQSLGMSGVSGLHLVCANSLATLTTGLSTVTQYMALQGFIDTSDAHTLDSGVVDFTRPTNIMYGINDESQWAQRNFNKFRAVRAPITANVVSIGPKTESIWKAFAAGWLVNNDGPSATLATIVAAYVNTIIESPNYTLLTNGVMLAEVNTTLGGIPGTSGLVATAHSDRDEFDYLEYFVSGGGGTKDKLYGRNVVFLITATVTGGVGQVYLVFQPRFSVTLLQIPPAQRWDASSTILHKEPLLGGNPVYFATPSEWDYIIGDIEVLDQATDFSPIGSRKELGYTQKDSHGHYEDETTYVEDDTTDEPPGYVDGYIVVPPISPIPTFNGVELGSDPFQDGSFAGHVNDITIGGYTYENHATPSGGEGAPTVVIPIGPVLLQVGSIEPIYPTYLGAFVFDLHYKKWGKMVQEHKNIFDIYPINTMAGEGIFPYETFLPKMACRLEDGTLPIFDQFPEEGEIVFGKIGFYRKGFTTLEEIRFQHREVMTGVLQLEGAGEDGRAVNPDLVFERDYENLAQVTEGFSISCPWFNVTFKGFFDLISLEARGYRAGKR